MLNTCQKRTGGPESSINSRPSRWCDQANLGGPNRRKWSVTVEIPRGLIRIPSMTAVPNTNRKGDKQMSRTKDIFERTVMASFLPNAPQQRPGPADVECNHSGLAGSAACGGYPLREGAPAWPAAPGLSLPGSKPFAYA